MSSSRSRSAVLRHFGRWWDLSGAVLLSLSLAVPLVMPRELVAADKRIYIALDDHTDYLWSADEATYRQVFQSTLDYYMGLTDQTRSNISAQQSRFNTDGSFWMWTYEQNRSTAEFEKLMEYVASGHISMPLNALVSTYGAQPAEAVLRGMYYAGSLERRFGVRFPIVHSIENQTLPYGLGSLWAGAGAKYSWRGICGCVTKVDNAGDRLYDAYYWTGPDDSRLLMKWNSMLTGNNAFMGGYAEARDASSVIDYVDSNAGFQARWPWPVIGAFGKGWDDVQTLTDEFVSIARAKTTASRAVIVSNELDFFQDFEANHGSGLPTLGVSFGNEWDLYSASLVETSARVKRSVEKLRAAEALAAVVSLEQPSFMDGRTSVRDLAWMDLGLFWEHDWTADGAISRDVRRDWQRRLASEIGTYVDTLHADASAALGSLIQRSGENPRTFVFNPLSFTREDVAELPWYGTSPVSVVDLSTGDELPSQLIPQQQRLQVWVSGVPSLGYKVLEVRAGAGQPFAAVATLTGNVIDHPLYKLTFSNTGAITSLLDKRRNNRELIAAVDGRAANDLGTGSGYYTLISSGPVSLMVEITAASPLSHTTRLTVYRNSDRISIENEITQNFSDIRTWAYGFNLSEPDLHHEEIGALVRAKPTTSGGIYSTRNARYDWLSVQHFADMQDGSGTVGLTVSNPDLAFARLGRSTPASLDTSTPQLQFLAGGQVDGSSWGIPNQGGDTRFTQRFALRSHGGYSPVSAMRFALEHQNPLVVGAVSGGQVLPATTHSFLSSSNQNVLAWTFKPADDGTDRGLVLRAWNLGDVPASTTFSLDRAVAGAERLTHVETSLGAIPATQDGASVSFAPRQLLTVLLRPEAETGPTPTPPPLTPSPSPEPTPDPTPSPTPHDDGGDEGEGCGTTLTRIGPVRWLSRTSPLRASIPVSPGGALLLVGLGLVEILRRRG